VKIIKLKQLIMAVFVSLTVSYWMLISYYPFIQYGPTPKLDWYPSLFTYFPFIIFAILSLSLYFIGDYSTKLNKNTFVGFYGICYIFLVCIPSILKGLYDSNASCLFLCSTTLSIIALISLNTIAFLFFLVISALLFFSRK
jgi:hypothetical protein